MMVLSSFTGLNIALAPLLRRVTVNILQQKALKQSMKSNYSVVWHGHPPLQNILTTIHSCWSIHLFMSPLPEWCGSQE